MTSETKNKHMTLQDRKEIQECLSKRMTFKSIAKRIEKSATTVSREVKGHMQSPTVLLKLMKRALNYLKHRLYVMGVRKGAAAAANSKGKYILPRKLNRIMKNFFPNPAAEYL